MRKDWKYGILDDAVTKGSSNISLNKIKDDEGDFPVYGAQGFVQNVSFFQQPKEYLAIIKDGAGIGRVSKHPNNSSILATMQYIIPKDGFDINFVQYFLNSIDFEKHRNGSTIPHIYYKDYKSEPFPLLTLQEQKRIVSILDKLFADIDKAKANDEQNIKNVKELFDCVLNNILYDKKWDVKELGKVCLKVEYGSSTKSTTEGKLPVLRMGNIQKGRFDWNKLVYSDNEGDNKQYLLKHNDVLFNRTNSPELVGKTAIYKSEMPAIFAGYLIRIHRKEDLLDADYLNFYLNSKMANEYGKTVMISSVNQANINGTKLKTYPIPLPPLQTQKAIVQKLDTLSTETKRLEAIYQQKLLNLEEMRKSILFDAFNGKL
ncbi:MAG TPA: type I restriction endonuclease subunit S [Bacteroidales bacterium]|nr:type I restriction endonuclease subunit S [Bacteroidales bacterium]